MTDKLRFLIEYYLWVGDGKLILFGILSIFFILYGMWFIDPYYGFRIGYGFVHIQLVFIMIGFIFCGLVMLE